LNWRALVEEALRRRKAEKLTQREHAALASVSIPTMASFERGEPTLTLAKAFDILRVVGLLNERPKEGAQEHFVRDAYARWRALSDQLPEDSVGRFPHGWYRIDYALEGDIKEVELHKLQDIIEQAEVRYTGWPMFLIPQSTEIAPQEVDGTLECWLTPEALSINKAFSDPAHCDFWRASPTGRMFLIRGYQEDGQETFPSGTIFDATLPTWRLGEGLFHAARLAALLKADSEGEITVRFRALYSGLGGRVLRPWANPLRNLTIEGKAARSDEALLEAVVPANEIEANLAEYVFPLVASLYERFGVTGLSENLVTAEIERLKKSRTA
jgi:transcriptional regulator with XRE-family HTH domain